MLRGRQTALREEGNVVVVIGSIGHERELFGWTAVDGEEEVLVLNRWKRGSTVDSYAKDVDGSAVKGQLCCQTISNIRSEQSPIVISSVKNIPCVRWYSAAIWTARLFLPVWSSIDD